MTWTAGGTVATRTPIDWSDGLVGFVAGFGMILVWLVLRPGRTATWTRGVAVVGPPVVIGLFAMLMEARATDVPQAIALSACLGLAMGLALMNFLYADAVHRLTGATWTVVVAMAAADFVMDAVLGWGPRRRGWASVVGVVASYVWATGLLVGAVHYLWGERRRARAERLLRAGRCPCCGYDLRASRGRCPECGGSIP